MNAVLRGDVHQIRVGHYSNIQDNCVLHGMKEQYGVYVGDYVTVGHSAVLHGCTIEARCLIGMGCIILNGAVIGSGSIIAAGTLIPEKTVVETKFPLDGFSRKISAAAGKKRRSHHPPLRRKLHRLQEVLPVGKNGLLVLVLSLLVWA